MIPHQDTIREQIQIEWIGVKDGKLWICVDLNYVPEECQIVTKKYLQEAKEQARAETEVKVRLEVFELIHKEFMKSNKLEFMDILERLQKETLSLTSNTNE